MDIKQIGGIGDATGRLYACIADGQFYWTISPSTDNNPPDFVQDSWEEISEELYLELIKIAI